MIRITTSILTFLCLSLQTLAAGNWNSNPSDSIPVRLVKDSVQNRFAGQRKNIIKFDPLIYTAAITSVAYERSLKPGLSIEAGAGFIGIGLNKDFYNEKNISGNFFRLGLKFFDMGPVRKKKLKHRMAGLYLKPELFYLQYQYDFPGTYQMLFPNMSSGTYHETYEVTGGALFVNVGYQWIISNAVVLDFFGGVGEGKRTVSRVFTTLPSLSSGKLDKTESTLFPGFIIQNGFGLQACFQAGFKVGLVFGK